MLSAVSRLSLQCLSGAKVTGRHLKTDIKTVMSSNWWREKARAAVPPLNLNTHKGQAGRVGVVGGSLEYTGAPYFAAISALKVGADLVHVFCTRDAAPVIKSYSPELIVHPLLDGKNGIEEIKSWLDRIHVLVIGPGLGRNEEVLDTVKQIILFCKTQNKPLVIDADGLYLITRNVDLIKNYPLPGVILTPNKVEYDRLHEVIGLDDKEIDYDKLGRNILILKKGSTDRTICSDAELHWTNDEGGSGRRCGGQGDLLSGATAVFFYWCIKRAPNDKTMLSAAIATRASSTLTRRCNEKAFALKKRGMVCSDMIDEINQSFHELYETHFFDEITKRIR